MIFLHRQVEKAKETTTVTEPTFTPLERDEKEEQKIVFSLAPIKREEDDGFDGVANSEDVAGPSSSSRSDLTEERQFKAPLRINALKMLSKNGEKSAASSRATSAAKSAAR